MKILKSIAKNWFRVDYRTLGIFRVAIGLVCFIDICRRFKYIDIFYSNYGVAPNFFMADVTSKYSAKAFTLLSSLGTATEVTVFFYIAAIFSFFFMIGYKTRLSHIITIITVLSIHNRLIILENGGDMVLNSFLIWTVFMPLGKRFSMDRLLFSLKTFRDDSPKSLNTGTVNQTNEPSYYWGLAYFACLLQLSIIYFFNYINKDGSTWEQGTSIYYFYQLDNFITPFGYFIKLFSLMPLWLSKILTFITIKLEFIIPILIIMPIFVLWTRRFSLITMIGFHVIIGISLYIGTFSWVMIAALLLLIASNDIEILKGFLKKLSSGPYVVFYDSDCGFCHQTARIIRRMDLFGNLTWAGRDWDGETPKDLESMRDYSIVVWDKQRDQVFIRHVAFSKIIGSLPWGFIDAWILMIPGISHFSGFIYDQISRNRTSISTFLGYSACDISTNHSDDIPSTDYQISPSGKLSIYVLELIKTTMVFILISASINYALTKNDGFRDYLKDNGYKPFKMNYKLNKISKQTRMIQKWNMFAPSVPRSFNWIVIEATLNDGKVIDLMTGKEPVYDKLDYGIYSRIDNSQFWRKYLGRIAKKNYKRYRPQLKKTLLSSNNPVKPYDDLNQDGKVNQSDRIKSVQLFKLSKSINSPLTESKSEKKVTKYKIDFDESRKADRKKNQRK